MTRQSDTLVNPVRMNTAWLNSDPVVTIAELLRLNKRLDQKIQLEMAPSVCDELINIFFLKTLGMCKKIRGNKMLKDKEFSTFFRK